MTLQNDYWQNRMENAQKLTEKQVSEKLKKLYQQANKRINKEIINIWIQMLEDGEISMANLYSSMRFSNLQNLLQRELLIIGRENEKYLSSSLRKVVQQSFVDFGEYIKKPKILSILDMQSAEQIIKESYKGAIYSERIWDNISKLRGVIENKIIESTLLGKDVRKVSKDLSQTMSIGYNESKRIAITETSRVFNEGCRQKAQDNGYKTYHLLLEPDACDECKKLKGEHFNINAGVLPVHPHCKCGIIIDLPEL